MVPRRSAEDAGVGPRPGGRGDDLRAIGLPDLRREPCDALRQVGRRAEVGLRTLGVHVAVAAETSVFPQLEPEAPRVLRDRLPTVSATRAARRRALDAGDAS